jgi:alpha-beta hydrolase superfamily lysophospholipase
MTARNWIIGAALGCCAIPGIAATEDAASACLGRAEAVLAALDGGEYEKARVGFDARMQAGLSAEQLRSVWESLPAQAGKRLAVAPGRTGPVADGHAAVIPLQYEKAWLELQIGCAADGSVRGLFVRPGSAPEPVAMESSTAWSERELAVASATLSLPGTLTLPRGKAQAGVVLVHGSGPNDRDETIGPNKVFRDLAHGLAERDIAVLRYEKRSHAHPESFAGKAFTVDEEVVDDAVAALQQLAAQPELAGKPVFVVGHSLGALLAPRIAARSDVAGVVMLAAPARALTEILPQQMNYIFNLDGSISDEERQQLDQVQTQIVRIEALTNADKESSTPLLGAPASYWLDLRDYDAVAQARALKRPILLLQGEGDYQVTMDSDFLAWQQAMKSESLYTARSFSKLSHLFMPAGDPPGPGDYEKPGHVDATVIDAMALWIKNPPAPAD